MFSAYRSPFSSLIGDVALMVTNIVELRQERVMNLSEEQRQ